MKQEHLGRYEYENIRIIISWLNWSEIITDGVIKLSLNLSNQSTVFVHMQYVQKAHLALLQETPTENLWTIKELVSFDFSQRFMSPSCGPSVSY